MKTSSRLGLLSAAALAALSLASPAHAAATRVGETADFLFGNTSFTFSVSRYYNAGPTSAQVTTPVHGISGNNMTASTLSNGTTIRFESRSSRYTGASQWTNGTASGSFVGENGVAVAAPITSAGTAMTGEYLVSTVGTQANGNSGHLVRLFNDSNMMAFNTVKSVEILWGSIEAANALSVYTGGAGANYFLSGADVLSAASQLGLGSGNDGSYYVTINAINGNTIGILADYAGGYSGRTPTATKTSMEWAVTSVSRDTVFVPVGTSTSDPAALPQAPAPVVGSTPAGGLLGLGLLGLVGLGRSRRRAAAAL